MKPDVVAPLGRSRRGLRTPRTTYADAGREDA